MMIVNARPTMNPFSTGSEMKLARNPSRSTPATSAASPVAIARRPSAPRSARPRPAPARRPWPPTAPPSRPSARRPADESSRTRRTESAPPAPHTDRRPATPPRSTRTPAPRGPAPPRPSALRSDPRAARSGRTRSATETRLSPRPHANPITVGSAHPNRVTKRRQADRRLDHRARLIDPQITRQVLRVVSGGPRGAQVPSEIGCMRPRFFSVDEDQR